MFFQVQQQKVDGDNLVEAVNKIGKINGEDEPQKLTQQIIIYSQELNKENSTISEVEIEKVNKNMFVNCGCGQGRREEAEERGGSSQNICRQHRNALICRPEATVHFPSPAQSTIFFVYMKQLASSLHAVHNLQEVCKQLKQTCYHQAGASGANAS